MRTNVTATLVKPPDPRMSCPPINQQPNTNGRNFTRPRSLPNAQHASKWATTESVGPSCTTNALQGSLPGPTTTAARLLTVLQAALQLWILQLRFQQPQHPTPFHQKGFLKPTTQHSTNHRAKYESAVRQLVSDLGPLWLKLGQTLAVRPDVVGPDLAAALAGLQESAPPFPGSVALDIIQEELGRPPQELFAWVSESPAASASLGQVHQAALKADGQLVAVKVQRPAVASQIALDLHVLTELLRGVRWAVRIKQDITAWATTLGHGLAQELDYVQEAHNLAEFAQAHSYLEFVDTPDVVWQLTTRRVLTTTWVEGQTTAQMLQQLRNPGTDSSNSSSTTTRDPIVHQPSLQQELLRLVDLGIQSSLHQLMVTGVLHADPHPGNLVLTGSKLVYLDFGLLVRVPEEASLAIMAAIIHWSQGQWLALAGDMRRMGLLKATTDLQDLADDLQQRFSQVHTAGTAADAPARAQVPDTPLTPAACSSGGCAAGDADSVAGSDSCPAARYGDEPSNTAARLGHESSNTAAAAVNRSTRRPSLLQNASAIGFAEFAGVVATLAMKYRFELPAYYTLIIRSLTTLEGIALTVSPTARSSIARAAVKVVARHLLSDHRSQAQQLLKELLLLPAASQTQEVSCSTHTLNLHLLEDILQLAVQNRFLLVDVASDAAISSEGDMEAWPGSFCTSTQQQSTAPRVIMMLCQQLGVPASSMAAQLSSPDATRVRALLAAHLAHRLSRCQWKRMWHRASHRVTSLVNASVQGVMKCCKWTSHIPCNEAAKRHVTPKAPLHESSNVSLLGIVVWWTGAGVSGVKLACQVIMLVADLVMRRVTAGFHKRMTSYDRVRTSCNST